MIAFLYLSAVFGLVSGETPFETIRRVTFFVVGLAPFVFLVGLLHARLARSAVGDLIVELQADPTPADLRDALSRALRDPSLTLVYWLPEFGTYAGLDGRPAELADRGQRARDDADRPRRRAGGGAPARSVARGRARAPRRGDGRGRDRARERAPARRASRPARGAARLARADGGRGQQGAPAAGAQPPRRRAAAARRALPRAEPARRRACGRDGGPGAADPGPARDRGLARGAPRDRPGDPSRRRQRARARRRPRAARRAGAGSGPVGGRDERAAAGGGRGRGVLPRLREPHERRQVRAGVVGDRRRQPLRTAACSSR